MTRISRSVDAKDLKEHGRAILAHGEVTGHHHEVLDACETHDPAELSIPACDFFEEPDGRRILLAHRACLLRHQEHAPIALDPANPEQFRQGDVFGLPIGDGAWEIRRQREYSPEAIRTVAD